MTVLLASPHFLQLLLAQAPRYSTGLSDTHWEAKTIALLCHIKEKEVGDVAVTVYPLKDCSFCKVYLGYL